MPSTAADRLAGLTTSVAVKAPCRVATTANTALSGLLTIDGVTLAAGDRVLVKDQTDAVENGIYVANGGDWERALDFNGSLDAVGGTQLYVTSGTAGADTYWRTSGDGTIAIDTDEIAFVPDPANSETVSRVSTRTVLAALPTGAGRAAILTEAGREGTFGWNSGNLSARVTADTQQGVYIAPDSDTTGAAGAWVRVTIEAWYNINWFGTFSAASRAGAVSLLQAIGGGVIFHPVGNYSFTTGVGYDLAAKTNIKIRGDGGGENGTAFIAGANDVKVISITGLSTRCGVEGIWIGSFAARTGCYGVFVEGTSLAVPVSHLSLRSIVIQNISTPLYMKNMQQSLDMANVRIFQSISGAVTGSCITTDTCVSFRLDGAIMQATAGKFGSHMVEVANDCDTGTFQNINGAGPCEGYGLLSHNPTGASGPRLMRYNDDYMEKADLSGYRFQDAGRDSKLRGCHAGLCGQNGMEILAGTVSSENFTALQNDFHGILCSNPDGTELSGSKCSNNSQDTTDTYDGIRIAAGARDVIVRGGRPGDYILGSVARQRMGLGIEANTDYIRAFGNSLEDNLSGAIENLSTGLNNSVDNPDDAFTGTLTGIDGADPTGNFEFSVTGRSVTLRFPALTGTSDSVACTITGAPERIWPKGPRTRLTRVVDNGATVLGTVTIADTGVMTLGVGAAAGAFTASAGKGTAADEITYAMD